MSAVWRYFTRENEKSPTAECKECIKSIPRGGSNGFYTTNLIRHLERHHPTLYEDFLQSTTIKRKKRKRKRSRQEPILKSEELSSENNVKTKTRTQPSRTENSMTTSMKKSSPLSVSSEPSSEKITHSTSASDGEISSKERTRKYRERLNADPVKREDILRARRKKYEEKKQRGEIKSFSVHLLPPSKQDSLREKWRSAQKKHRKNEADAPQNLKPPSLEVQTLVDKEVCCAMKRNETKLRGLIEMIQRLDHKVDYESSIQKLEARIKLLSKRAEVAIAYMTRTQGEASNPFLINSTSRLDPEDEQGGNRSESQRSLDGKMKKRKISQIMETTVCALNQLHSMRKDVRAVITDLADPTRTQQCSEISPFKVFEHLLIKEEPRDPEIDADTAVEPRAELKGEFFSSASAVTSTSTDPEQPSRECPYPPLPTFPFPPVLNMRAASYSIPQKPEVHVALIREPAGLSVLWKVEKEDPTAPPMATYSIYMTTEKKKGSNIFPEWSLIDEVKAFKLPMCVMMTKYKQGRKLCVALLGKDIFGRYGPFSDVVMANIPD